MANKKNTKTEAGASTSTAGDLDDTMLCDNDACTCEEADVVRGSQRFCSEACADMTVAADENADVAGEEEFPEETCACGHAECEASVSAGAGEERGTGRQPSRTPPGRE